MLRYVPLAAIAMAVLTHAAPAQASATAYTACRDAAADARALKRCGTFRAEVRECRALRAAGQDAPAACMEGKVSAWRGVLEREERRATAQGLRSQDGFVAWSEDLRALCRDEEEQRLSAERYGTAHAAFEAAQCELRSTIRRVIETSGKLRGFD